jgi:hypothetical protein
VSLTLNAIGGVLLLPAPATADLTPPTAVLSVAAAADGTSVTIASSDTGSGVSRILYWVDGGPVASVAASTATVGISGDGAHIVSVRVLDNAGNISRQYTQLVNMSTK